MLDETRRRRAIQRAYNEEHGITPRSVTKDRSQIMKGTVIAEENAPALAGKSRHADQKSSLYAAAHLALLQALSDDQKRDLVAQMRIQMLEAAEKLDFERAAELRDAIVRAEAELVA